MSIYRGFSTVANNKKFRLTDFELARQDLLNHFQIRKGEKISQPTFGTIIWDVLFEPMTDQVKAAISADVMTIVKYDPRLKMNTINIIEYEHGIQIELDLTYIPTNQSETMRMTFDQATSQT